MLSLVDIINIKDENVKKMEIKKIKLCGYRNVESVTLNLSKITPLISLNSFGKSNVLTGIDFGIDFIHNPSNIKKNMMAFQPAIPINKSNQSNDYSLSIEFISSFKKSEYLVNYEFSFSWIKNEKDAEIKSESLRIKLLDKNQKFNQLILRESNKSVYKSSQTGRCSSNIKICSDELIVNKLLAFDNYYYLEIVKQVNNLKMYIDRHLDASSYYEIDPIITKGSEPLELNGIGSIPRAIYALKKDYQDKFELLKNSFIMLFPFIQDVIIKEIDIKKQMKNIPNTDNIPFTIDDKVYVLFVIDERLNQPLRFEHLSDGAKRVFLLLTYAIIADLKGLSLLVIEEPENSIHPSLFQSYLEVLNRIVKNCKIIITSHSPYVIQYLSPSSIYIGVTNSRGIADFKKIANTKVSALLKDADDCDQSTGNYIFDLLSGSKDDLDLLNLYLEESDE